MKTLEDILLAKENYEAIEIKLANGKTMELDFNMNWIIRASNNGVECIREFHGNKPKMIHLGKRYLTQQ